MNECKLLLTVANCIQKSNAHIFWHVDSLGVVCVVGSMRNFFRFSFFHYAYNIYCPSGSNERQAGLIETCTISRHNACWIQMKNVN